MVELSQEGTKIAGDIWSFAQCLGHFGEQRGPKWNRKLVPTEKNTLEREDLFELIFTPNG